MKKAIKYMMIYVFAVMLGLVMVPTLASADTTEDTETNAAFVVPGNNDKTKEENTGNDMGVVEGDTVDDMHVRPPFYPQVVYPPVAPQPMPTPGGDVNPTPIPEDDVESESPAVDNKPAPMPTPSVKPDNKPAQKPSLPTVDQEKEEAETTDPVEKTQTKPSAVVSNDNPVVAKQAKWNQKQLVVEAKVQEVVEENQIFSYSRHSFIDNTVITPSNTSAVEVQENQNNSIDEEAQAASASGIGRQFESFAEIKFLDTITLMALGAALVGLVVFLVYVRNFRTEDEF
jgi:hypothetical protein